MQEFQNITQQNQVMMGKIATGKPSTDKYKDSLSTAMPASKLKVEEEYENAAGKRHYNRGLNVRDSVADIIAPEENQETEMWASRRNTKQEGKRAMSEYKRTICRSAEKRKE